MRFYVKDVAQRDEFLQVINTNTSRDLVAIPLPGEEVLNDYIVTKREWQSLEPGKERIIIWVKKKEIDPGITLVFMEEIPGIFRKSGEDKIYETDIPSSDLRKLPTIGEEIDINGKSYIIREIKKSGNFLVPEKVIFTVIEN